ncbi:beta-ketoacyl synthase N-terminal-like domain-containing protein [Streptosporangium sp. NPDC000396]|uniref:beta-ketoacyl synthase N-terminal-like domain-containing protein n=1 Tax=Streptosporangium sp. NPDC000396 TaxID=3366185 RepID=UPI00368AF70D
MNERILVTGIGMISPAGAGAEPFWADLCAARRRFEELTPLYPGMKPGVLGALVPGTARPAGTRRASLFAESAALEAIRDAGLAPGDPSLLNALVCVGTNDGHADVLEDLVAGRRDLAGTGGFASSDIADDVARAVGASGPAFTVHNTCASANVALSCALEMLRAGVADTAVVGGCDTYSEKNIIGFSSLHAIGPVACRPFSRERRYVTPSEGAGIMVLQTGRAARGRRPYAELLTVAVNNDARHPTAPDPEGVAGCHRQALDQCGLKADDIDAIFAHGTGSRANDSIEGSIFAETYPHAAITAIKGTVGHLMGAAGAAGAVASCLALSRRLMPPTAVGADEVELDIDLVTGTARAVPRLRHVQNNAFGFGGHNAIAIFGAVTGDG